MASEIHPPEVLRSTQLVEWREVSRDVSSFKSPVITRVIECVGKTHVNGGMRIGCFSLIHGLSVDAIVPNEAACLSSLFTSEALQSYWPDFKPYQPTPEFHTSRMGTYSLEGEITEVLLSSGAYVDSDLTERDARQLSEKFMDVIAAGNRKSIWGYRIDVVWAEWFCDVAWDHTVVIVDYLRNRWWVICTTDTD